MEFGKAFGEVLRALRTEKDVTQEELAEKCNYDRVFISNLERGVRLPSLKTVFRIAKALDCNASEIIQAVESKDPEDP